MPGAAYRSISNPRQYEKLRAKGFSKESAARITNASANRIGKSAFGVDHGQAIAKAGPLAITSGLSRGARASARVRSTAAGAARAAGRRTAGTRRTARDFYVGSPIRRPGTKVHRPEHLGGEPLMRELPNRRKEFVRGMSGGAMGEQYMFNARRNAQMQAATLASRAVRQNRSAKNPATHVRAVVAGTREGLRARRMTGAQASAAYRATAAGQRAGSRHPGAFTAGARTGRGATWAANHPGTSQAILAGGLGGTAVGVTVAADRREAKRRAAKKRAQVRKGVMRQVVLPAAAATAVGTGLIVGSKEADRRLYNRRGSNVSFKDSQRHPIRSAYQYRAVEHRDVARGLEDYARKQRVKAKQATDPAKAEYHRLRAARGRDVANFHHHQAHTYNAAARHGGAGSAKRAGEWQRYDKTQRYKSPQTIGKSAFGIDHGQALAKAADSSKQSRRRQATRGVEIGGSVAAGTVGSAFGAAKLRDSYKQEHPEAFTRGVNRAHWFALRRGVKPARAFKLNRIATSGKPGFVPLATAVTAGSIATGARRYGQLQDRKAKKSQVAKSFPRSGYIPRIGKVRVLEYHDTGHFTVLDNRDFKHRVHRDQIKFHKEQAVSKSAFGIDHGQVGKGIAGDFSMGRKMAAGLSSASQVTTPAAKLGGAVQRGVSATANAVADKGVLGAAKSGTLKAIKPLPVKTALAGGAGGAVGAAVAGRKDNQDKVPVTKSAFGVEHNLSKGLNPLRGIKNAAGVRDFVAAGESAPQAKAVKAAAQEAELGEKLGRFRFRETPPPTSHAAPRAGRGRALKTGAVAAGTGAATAAGSYEATQAKKKPAVAKSAFGVALS
jgi:hypothetical protein